MTICIRMRTYKDATSIIHCFPKEEDQARRKNSSQLSFLKNRLDKDSDCIVLVKGGHWYGYNDMDTSGPNTNDDWCKIHNSKLYTINEIITNHPELMI